MFVFGGPLKTDTPILFEKPQLEWATTSFLSHGDDVSHPKGGYVEVGFV